PPPHPSSHDLPVALPISVGLQPRKQTVELHGHRVHFSDAEVGGTRLDDLGFGTGERTGAVILDERPRDLPHEPHPQTVRHERVQDRKSTRLNSSHVKNSY